MELLDELLELGEVGTEKLTDLRALVVGLEGGHGANSGGGRDLAELIDIDLDKCDILVLSVIGESVELGANDLAGTIIIRVDDQMEVGALVG